MTRTDLDCCSVLLALLPIRFAVLCCGNALLSLGSHVLWMAFLWDFITDNLG